MQEELFTHQYTTALYPNRLEDKQRVESECGLREFGDNQTSFTTPKGNLFATGYVRIVYGDHGPYVEFLKEHIKMRLKPKFNRPCPPKSYYEWLLAADNSDIKIYDQKRDVHHLPNPPLGGFRGNRKEGYADYKPGMIYISPYELQNAKNL